MGGRLIEGAEAAELTFELTGATDVTGMAGCELPPELAGAEMGTCTTITRG
jgi:hypothetical protein